MKKIEELKNDIIKGTFIDLVPITREHIQSIVDLRNQEKNRYFLNQQIIIDYDSQLKWYEEYLKRENDIYWAIYNKNNDFIGTIRIYDIDFDNNLCDQGSFMINDKFSLDAPYAIEAELLSLNFVFYELGITKVINEDREDNKVMNSLSKKIGFEFIRNTYINEVKYNYYILSKENYEVKKEKLNKIIEMWSNR